MNHDEDKKRHDTPGAGPSPPERASNDPGPVTVELLSAYLEDPDDLSSGDRELVERELAENADVQRMFRQLDSLTAELGNLPQMEPSRSYRLTPPMLGATEPTRIDHHEAWHMRHMDKVRWAAAAAAILFVLVVTADLMTNGLGMGGSMDDDDSDAGVMMSADDEESARSPDEEAVADGDMADEPEVLEELPEEAADDDAAVDDQADESDESGDASDDAAGVPEEEADQDDGGGIDGDPGDALATPEPPVEEEQEEQEEADTTPDAEIFGEPSDDTAQDGGADAEGTPSFGELESAQVEGDTEASATEPEDDRTIWRAIEFSLIIIVAVLLALIIFLPRRHRREW